MTVDNEGIALTVTSSKGTAVWRYLSTRVNGPEKAKSLTDNTATTGTGVSNKYPVYHGEGMMGKVHLSW